MYNARLNLRLRQAAATSRSDEAGFDIVQFKQPEEPTEEDPAPDYEAKDGKEKGGKRPEMREVDSGISIGASGVGASTGPSRTSAAA